MVDYMKFQVINLICHMVDIKAFISLQYCMNSGGSNAGNSLQERTCHLAVRSAVN